MSGGRLAHPWRFRVMLALLSAGFAALGWRGYSLQVAQADYLRRQAEARQLRVVTLPAVRGVIRDRHGRPLAVSTPVFAVWADPGRFSGARRQWPALARLLGTSVARLAALQDRYRNKSFMYLARQVTPRVAEQVRRLKLPGVGLRPEYRRYYPAGPVTAHLVGFTNVDGVGQEGLERAFDRRLRGRPGKKLVRLDGRRDVIEDVASLVDVREGRDLTVTLDSRLQYLGFRILRDAVAAHGARGGSLVILDARSGELLALVSQPSFNPNRRAGLKGARLRNRPVTDVFEPGSTAKPFTIAAALESHRFVPDSKVDTAPGWIEVGGHRIRDEENLGRLTVSRVIVKSSNVGASRIALALPARTLWSVYSAAGFGRPTGVTLPGEAAGRLRSYRRWSELEQATLSFGYGLSVTALQLARAYTLFANDGVLLPVRLTPGAPGRGERVLSPAPARAGARMLEEVVGPQGTGAAAAVARYRVAGKTGTVHKVVNGEYSADRYLSLFAGFAPASDPRLVGVVVIDEPRRGGYYGGRVAAPVFARVMAGALRLLNVPPDDLDGGPALRVAGRG